jgi:Xaa-Pro aminopeptidase
MRYTKINKDLFIKNRKKILSALDKDSIAVVNSNDQMPSKGDQTFKYVQNPDFFYLTGIEQEKSILLLLPEEKKTKEILFILKAEKELEIWEGHKLTQEEAKELSGIETVKWLGEFDATLREYAFKSNDIYLNINEYLKFSTDVKYRDLRFIEDMKENYPLHQFKRFAPILTKARLKKEPEEIELMQKACDITEKAFRRILGFIKPGIKEYEIEAEITHEFLRNGANGHAYDPIIASGKNNCVLHYVSNDQVCKEGDLVLMDFGAEYAGYAADTTRTVPVNGKFSPRQREVYESVLRVLRKSSKLIKPGGSINDVNKKTNRYIEEELIHLGLASQEEMKDKKKKDTVRMKYFMHGTSHFMGLDVHDVGGKDVVFEPGMVMSCEPGIYIEEEGFGIRLENDILVTEDGNIDLLASEPIEPDEIEGLMAK